MCVHINTEAAAKRYVNEYRRGLRNKPNEYLRNSVRSWQQHYKWLLDYDLDTCAPMPKLTGKPGMKAVKQAIREAEKTTVPVATKKKVAA